MEIINVVFEGIIRIINNIEKCYFLCNYDIIIYTNEGYLKGRYNWN